MQALLVALVPPARSVFDSGTMTSLPASRTAPSDVELLRQAAQGEEAALGSLYDRYASLLFGLALRITGERADAEEVVLDAFAQAWRDAAKFEPGRGSAGAWLTMICRSRALDLVRARGRRARLVDSAQAADPAAVPAMGTDADPGRRDPEHAERRRVVREAVEQLSAPQRAAIELAYYEGLSHSQIAERLGEPLGTIKTRLRFAMQKLRDALRPYYFEPGL
ncbi:MAG: sigma-70 family RNA polymerase sigma factor [Gemmatimonadales bacterium]